MKYFIEGHLERQRCVSRAKNAFENYFPNKNPTKCIKPNRNPTKCKNPTKNPTKIQQKNPTVGFLEKPN
jgi:hypothetical protein